MAKLYNQKTVAENKASIGNVNTQKFLYTGFNSRNKTTGFKLYDLDLVKQDILNHFNIKKGQKLENPLFGTIIWDMLYEPMNEVNKKAINEDVTRIVNADPRVSVTRVQVDATDQGIRIEVELAYLNTNVTEKMSINFDKTK
jgi:phage baseplate assembly protein W